MPETLVVSLYLDRFDVYIGRAGHGQRGTFGNPFFPRDGGRVSCLERFRDYFLGRVRKEPEFRRQIEALRGKRLACFCAPKGGLPPEPEPAKAKCHGQIIAAYLEGLLQEDGSDG